MRKASYMLCVVFACCLRKEEPGETKPQGLIVSKQKSRDQYNIRKSLANVKPETRLDIEYKNDYIMEQKGRIIMLTTKEAKENTDEIREKWNADSWKAIGDHIEDVIKRGEYSTRLILTTNECEKLLDLGYTLTHIGNPKSTTYDIFWK